MPKFQTRIVQFAWLLCAINGACIATWLQLGVIQSHHSQFIISFVKPGVAETLGLVALTCSASLIILLIRACITKAENIQQLALAMFFTVSPVLLFPLLLVLSFGGFLWGGLIDNDTSLDWAVDRSLKSQDGHTYYILHAPPPANGAGDWALARRLSGNRFLYTVQILSQADNEQTILDDDLYKQLKRAKPLTPAKS